MTDETVAVEQSDRQAVAEPVAELVAMLEAGTRQEGTHVFDHTPEEFGLHVMENAEVIRSALAHPRPALDREAVAAIIDSVAWKHPTWMHWAMVEPRKARSLEQADAILALATPPASLPGESTNP